MRTLANSAQVPADPASAQRRASWTAFFAKGCSDLKRSSEVALLAPVMGARIPCTLRPICENTALSLLMHEPRYSGSMNPGYHVHATPAAAWRTQRLVAAADRIGNAHCAGSSPPRLGVHHRVIYTGLGVELHDWRVRGTRGLEPPCAFEFNASAACRGRKHKSAACSAPLQAISIGSCCTLSTAALARTLLRRRRRAVQLRLREGV